MSPSYPSLAGRVALVTGAGAGIGRATAAQLSDNDVTVVGMDISETPSAGGPSFEDVVSEGELVVGDVSESEDVERAVERAREYGDVSIVVNNAGIGSNGKIEEIDLETWRRTFEVHVEGTYQVCRRVLPRMAERSGGSVINVSSIAGIGGYPATADYGAAKGAIANLTRELAVDYSPDGVRINAVAPGFIKTSMNETIWREDRSTEEGARVDYETVTDRTLLPRLGEPSDIATVVTFLASDSAGFLTGHVLPVDGGWTSW